MVHLIVIFGAIGTGLELVRTEDGGHVDFRLERLSISVWFEEVHEEDHDEHQDHHSLGCQLCEFLAHPRLPEQGHVCLHFLDKRLILRL